MFHVEHKIKVMAISIKLLAGKDNKEVLIVPNVLKLEETLTSIKTPLGDWLQPISFVGFGKGVMEVCIDGSFYKKTMAYGIMPAEIRKGVLAEMLMAIAQHVGFGHVWVLDFVKNTTTRPLSLDEIENRLYTRALGAQTNASLNSSLTKEAAKENAIANLDDVQYAVYNRRIDKRAAEKQLKDAAKQLTSGK